MNWRRAHCSKQVHSDSIRAEHNANTEAIDICEAQWLKSQQTQNRNTPHPQEASF